jgi:O-antigen ligase
MFNNIIKLILVVLLVLTPIIFGSMELWAFSSMELGILLMIVLWALQSMIGSRQLAKGNSQSLMNDPNDHNVLNVPNVVIVFLCLFLLLVLFQMVPLPSGIIKIISPKTFSLTHSLTSDLSPLTSPYGLEPSALSLHLSFVPFATKIEFLKWLTLTGLFLLLLNWKGFNRKTTTHLILIIMLVGVTESLYGMLEFFSGDRRILYLDMGSSISAVTGTFINRNYFAGYLLMVIPLSLGYFFSREAFQKGQFMGWRNRLSSLDGKTFLIAFGIIVMILGLLFSASRMGIVSLLLSFSLITLLFRGSQRRQRFSKTTVLIFGLAILWALWIGLDVVVSRFFTSSEDFKSRWMIWVNTFQIFKDFPIFGSGLGTFIHLFPMYRSFHITGFHSHAENDFLQLLSDVGLIGAGLLLLVFVFLFFRAVSGIRSFQSSDSKKYIAIGGMVGILALMFHSLVERNIQVPSNAFLYTFLWALVLRISEPKTPYGAMTQ